MLLFILALCGFSGALAIRLLDPLITSIASDFGSSVGVVALLSSAFALPFGLSQPVLGPLGDALGKATVIKAATLVLALCLLGSALAPNLTVLFVSRVLGGVAAGGIMPVCMALIGDSFPLALRQVAISRYVGASMAGQLAGVSAGGIIAESIGWRGVLGCSAALAIAAAIAALLFMPRSAERPSPVRLDEALARYRLVLANPRSLVCFGVVFLDGLAVYGITPFIGEMLRSRDAGGLREAGFVVGGLGLGGILFMVMVPAILTVATRPTMMVAGGAIGAIGLAGLGFQPSWGVQMALMIVLGFGFFLLHNPVQTEVTELAPSARASAFSLHAFSFFLGQALGPMLYGTALPIIGPMPTMALGAVILAGAGLMANRLLRVRPGRP